MEVTTMKKTNKSYTLSLSVEYALIADDDKPTSPIPFVNDDIYATQWLHDQGYKAYIKGNTLVVYKDYGWAKVESRYVIIPNVEYHDYKADRNYTHGLTVARRFAMAHTIAIVHKINAG